jgi:DHA1 family tetracycline resistance protein-like MFS transporter
MKKLTVLEPTSHDTHVLAIEDMHLNAVSKKARSIIALLTVSCSLMMTGFGIASPVFARRLSELGAGVEVLSLMAMASALAQFLLAPCMGALSDRFGRRLSVLFALSGLAITNLAFLLVRSTWMFIVLRFLQGAFSVGMLPAVMGMVAELVPVQLRTRCVGVIMGGYAVGFTFGPIIGGLLFTWLGFTAPLGIAALLDLLALLITYVKVYETSEPSVPSVRQTRGQELVEQPNLLAFIPRPRSLFALLLLLDFIAAFGMAFIEPQMVFYLYNTLAWTTAQYGFMMGGYGVATLLGQAAIGWLGNHFDGKLLLALGFLFNSALSFGLLFFRQFSALAPFALFAGLGSAFITTRLGVSYLDMSVAHHRSVVVGIRESAISFGAVAGPLLATLAGRWLIPQGIFSIATLTTLTAVMLVLVVLKPQNGTNESARVSLLTGRGERISSTITITSIVARLAHSLREAYFDLSHATHRAVCALPSALSQMTSQGGYNEEDEDDPIECMAA